MIGKRLEVLLDMIHYYSVPMKMIERYVYTFHWCDWRKPCHICDQNKRQ